MEGIEAPVARKVIGMCVNSKHVCSKTYEGLRFFQADFDGRPGDSRMTCLVSP